MTSLERGRRALVRAGRLLGRLLLPASGRRLSGEPCRLEPHAVEPRPAPSPLEIERIDHVNMRVADLAASIAFYRRVFGFELKEDRSDAAEPWAIVGRAGVAYLCLYEHRGKPLATEGLLLVHFGFALPPHAFDAARLALQQMGVPLEFGGPVSWPRSRSVYVKDPSGYVIEISERVGGGLG